MDGEKEWRVKSKPHRWQETSELEYSFPIVKLRCRIGPERNRRKDVPMRRRHLGASGSVIEAGDGENEHSAPGVNTMRQARMNTMRQA